eukprot:322725_1
MSASEEETKDIELFTRSDMDEIQTILSMHMDNNCEYVYESNCNRNETDASEDFLKSFTDKDLEEIKTANKGSSDEITMSNISLIFPPQQTLSIKETINTDLPEFIPHYEVIFMGISDLFRSKLQSLTPSDQSYLDSLKSSSDNDKAIASEIALWHHQTDYALQCVTDIENNALCKRMQLMLTKTGEDRKQIKRCRHAQPFERDDEYKFVLLDYNFQTFSGSTADSNAIDVLLKTELNN